MSFRKYASMYLPMVVSRSIHREHSVSEVERGHVIRLVPGNFMRLALRPQPSRASTSFLH